MLILGCGKRFPTQTQEYMPILCLFFVFLKASIYGNKFILFRTDHAAIRIFTETGIHFAQEEIRKCY